MSELDPLKEAEDGGYDAARMILEDIGSDEDMHDAIQAIRTAALNDSKFNYHLIEWILRHALIGFEKVEEELEKP
jgi:hypothetical protein